MVQELSSCCFSHCSCLSDVTFEEKSSVKFIGNLAFADSGVTCIRVPKSVQIISTESFVRCVHLSEVTFDEESVLKELGKSVFAYSGLKSFQVPKSVQKIAEMCFYPCKLLTEVVFTVESSIKHVEHAALPSSCVIAAPSDLKELFELTIKEHKNWRFY